jgi:hypothetical protein
MPQGQRAYRTAEGTACHSRSRAQGEEGRGQVTYKALESRLTLLLQGPATGLQQTESILRYLVAQQGLYIIEG